MRRMTMAMGRFMYGTWYGAVVVYVAVVVALFGLQFANCCMGDLVPWPKGIHFLVMLAAVANIGVAVIVSCCRSKRERAIGQLLLCVVAFAGCLIVALVSYCIPTRSAVPPCREWTEEAICRPSAIAYDNLAFLGGISTRENVEVFAVADSSTIDKSRFSAGSPWANVVGDQAIAHYRRIMEFCRIDVSLPDDTALSHCYSGINNITLVEADGKAYLVYERL